MRRKPIAGAVAAVLGALGAGSFTVAAEAGTRTAGPPGVHANLAIYLLKGRSAPGPVPLTLDEALAGGRVEVHETGNVRELKIENKGAEPVFVQWGEIVKGGRQDRVLTVSLVLGPHSGMVPIGAYCVEQGRWSARSGEDVARFASSDAILPSRETRFAIARPVAPFDAAAAAGVPEAPPARSPIEAELGAAARRDAGAALAREAVDRMRSRPDHQAEVWSNVAELQDKLSMRLAASVASERSKTSLQLSLENKRLQEAIATYTTALQGHLPPEGDDVVGIAVAIGGRIATADVYPSAALLRKMWPRLLRAAATEAVSRADEPSAEPPSPAAVEAFLAATAEGKASERVLGGLVRIETRESERGLRVVSTAARGGEVHIGYVAR